MRTVDPHLNLFHAYRGASHDEGARERQLEDNLTRALAITITRVEARDARAILLGALGIEPERALGFERCELQVTTAGTGWPSPARRRLLVVHGGPRLRLEGPDATASEGRADAVFVGRDFLVAIESKLGNSVARSQLRAHAATLGIPADALGDVTWPGICRTTGLALRSAAEPSLVTVCMAVNARGQPCRAAPLRDGPFCRMHAPEHATDVGEARRLGGLRRRREVTIAAAYDINGISSARDVLRLLELAAFDTIGLDNTVARARALAQIAHAAIRALEAGAFEERLDALEETMRPRHRAEENEAKRPRGRRADRERRRP